MTLNGLRITKAKLVYSIHNTVNIHCVYVSFSCICLQVFVQFCFVFGGKVWRTPAEQLRWKLQKSHSELGQPATVLDHILYFYPALNQNDQQFWKTSKFSVPPMVLKKDLCGFALRVSTSQSTFGWSWRHMAPTELHHHGLQHHDRFPSQKPRCRTKVPLKKHQIISSPAKDRARKFPQELIDV